MKKKLPKLKRPNRFLRQKKSLPLSVVSIKKTPKRKLKSIAKKAGRAFIIFFSLFLVSLVVLFIGFYHKTSILNPIYPFTDVLGTQQVNQSAVIAPILAALHTHNISFVSVSTQGNGVLVVLSDGTDVLFSSEKDISNQIDSLQVTINNLTIEGKRISRVDMRFERPVVTFK